MLRRIRDNLWGVLALVGLIWLIFGVSFVIDLKPLALVPRTIKGLSGILTLPFLHQDLKELLGNTVPLTVLLFMLRATRKRPWRILVSLFAGSGTLLWVFGRPEPHMGCSVLLYSLAAYLIAAGVCERKPLPIAAAVLVTVLYGTLFWGLFSWDGQLLGAFFGAIYAQRTLRGSERRSEERGNAGSDAANSVLSGNRGIQSETSQSQAADFPRANDGLQESQGR
jgi:membrane associated rhomboid family serine protease